MPRLSRRQLGPTLLLVGLTFGGSAWAQTPDELAAGRQLFAEALDDEEHHRYEVALEKYQRVLRIRDTAATRYRIGLSLEGLGRNRQAIDSYGAAVRIGSSSDSEVVKA